MAREVRVAVLGASAFAETAHVPGVEAHPRGRVVAIYSRNRARARALAARCGVPDASDDLPALLARRDIDAVTVAGANAQHHPYAMAAIAAGKHVFCEKPMALDAAQAADMTLAAAGAGVIAQVAFIFRHTFALEEMRRIVRAGAIGAPYFVQIEGQRYERQAVATVQATWRSFASEHGAGQLGEIGSHYFDAVNFVCGEPCGPVAAVAALTHTVPREAERAGGQRVPVETPDLAALLLRTEGALQGQVLTSRATPPAAAVPLEPADSRPARAHGWMTVTGTRGALMCVFSRGEADALWRREPEGEWRRLPLPQGAHDGRPHAIDRMMAAFVDGVLGEAPERAATFEDGYRSQSAVDAALRAAASGRWESVDTRAPGVAR
ncbi:MAG TPA: Gfo/Idh/MocA family oxidoreductase [Dehalococcoidia bacterium]|nr:Gfo/Idh/MocA family oxidoreductase [Dehalococcoidia bacterium]